MVMNGYVQWSLGPRDLGEAVPYGDMGGGCVLTHRNVRSRVPPQEPKRQLWPQWDVAGGNKTSSLQHDVEKHELGKSATITKP